MTEFRIGDHEYRADKLSARTAFHVARRFALVWNWLAEMKHGIAAMPPPERFAQALVGVSGNLPQADVDYVLDSCFAVVFRRTEGGVGWAPVRGPSGGMQYDDVGIGEQMQIVWRVAEANGLVDFFYVQPDASPPP